MKVVLADGDRIENHGTIMHIAADAVSDVTIVSHGTIMNASGCRIIKGGNYQKQEPQGIVIREVARRSDLERIEQLEIDNRKLLADNERLRNNSVDINDRKWGFKRIKELNRTINSLRDTIDNQKSDIKHKESTIEWYSQECNRLRSREYVRHLESETENLHNQLVYYERQNNDLQCQLAVALEKLEKSDRCKLEDEIEELKDKIARALNRERVLKMKAEYAEHEARIAKSQVWDDFKPTKEQVKEYYKTVRQLMDCETNNEEIFT